MPSARVLRQVPIQRTARAMQLEGIFDVPPSSQSECSWTIEMPIEDFDWQVGLIVGPSGSGKSTVAKELFQGSMVDSYSWPSDQSVVDGFPADMGIKDITALLSSVGFSSPPSWLRPFRVLSNGEQFRATLARALCDPREIIVLDEFTSVVDRTVAKIGSSAVAKSVRRMGRKIIAVTCHCDVEEWLCPDWVLEMPNADFRRRSLRPRPAIELEVCRVRPEAWKLFKHHHYLNTSMHKVARCFCAFWGGRPVAFSSAMHSPGKVSVWREHRTVCLPDFQGVGIGNALSEFVASVMAGKGKGYYSVTSNPAMIRHRAKSRLWTMIRKPKRTTPDRVAKNWAENRHVAKYRSVNRLVAGFKYVGPVNWEACRSFGV